MMKNKRTKTNATLEVDMPDGSVWSVPVQVIADDRDRYYSRDKEDTIGLILNGFLNEYEIIDWASNHMNWEDVEKFATMVVPPQMPDFHNGWINRRKWIKGLKS